MMDDHTRDDLLQKAQKRHGRAFITEVPVTRVTAKSPFLRRLERLQKAEAGQRAPVLQLQLKRKNP